MFFYVNKMCISSIKKYKSGFLLYEIRFNSNFPKFRFPQRNIVGQTAVLGEKRGLPGPLLRELWRI